MATWCSSMAVLPAVCWILCWGHEQKISGTVLFYIGNVATLDSSYFVIRHILFRYCCFAYCSFLEPAVQLQYCPGQVPIGAFSSNIKH